MITPNIYQALVISKALVLYCEHGIRVNRAYTPKAMMQMAARITGQRFAPRDYQRAANELRAWAERATQ